MSKKQIAIQSNIWLNNSVLKQKRQNQSKQNYMPFLFRSKRQFPFTKNDQMPPVGTYKVPNLFDATKDKLQSLGYNQGILKQQYLKQNQMVIFKSKKQRFNSNVNQIPGPASYNYLEGYISHNKTHRKGLKNSLQNNQKFHSSHNILGILKRNPSCPAIPSSNLKYGYQKDQQGNYKKILKSQQQLTKEKRKLKQYCSTLVNENIYQKLNASSSNTQLIKNNLKQNQKLKKYSSSRSSLLNKKQQIIQKFEKINHQTIQNNSSLINLNKSKLSLNNSKINNSKINNQISNNKNKNKKIIKPKIKLSYTFNHKIPIYDQKHLGPGCYNVDLDTLKKLKKIQTFQFFGSTQKRFILQEKLNNSSGINPYQYLFLQKKNMIGNKKNQGKIYKKSLPYTFNPNYVQRQIQKPGPGYYQPQYQKVKKTQACGKFGYQSRFKQPLQKDYLPQEIDQQMHQKDENGNSLGRGTLWGNLRKQKIQSPQIRYQTVKQQQIYGIMNEQPQKQMNQSNYKQNFNFKDQTNNIKNKQSPMFLDKSQRFNPCQKTYYEGDENINLIEAFNNMHNSKGSFISKLSKKLIIQTKQNTPGPGTYQGKKIQKKSFNLKNN